MSHYREIAKLANENVDVRSIDYVLGAQAIYRAVMSASAQSSEPADTDFIGLAKHPKSQNEDGDSVVHLGAGHFLTLVEDVASNDVIEEVLI